MAVLFYIAIFSCLTACAAIAPVPPEGDAGIAGKYPGDVGIERDPNVLFVERFDERSIDQVFSRWDDPQGQEFMTLAKDAAPGSADGQSLLMTHIGGRGTGSQLYRRLLPGYDQIFARFYVKFDPKCYAISHFGTCLGGNNPPTKDPMVRAGFRTQGDKSFWSGLEPFGDTWNWGFYTYWKDMRSSPPSGQYWGNTFCWGAPGLAIPKGKWICVEIMMKMNDPVTDSNGEQAFWIDGQLIRWDKQIVSWSGKGFPLGHWTYDKFCPEPGGRPFEGFQWRTVKELNVNFVWAYLYITKAPPGYVSRVWYDNIVVAKSYIGPIATTKSTPASKSKMAPPPGWESGER
jgi:hypothetical protein